MPAGDGHAHSLSGKPTGSIPNGLTDAVGELRVNYSPSEFAGVYRIEAGCGGCSNVASTTVTVRVPGLVALPPDSAVPPRYVLVGSTSTHPSNHFFTTEALEALDDIVALLHSAGWGVVGVNDASLSWGGRFDISGGWAGSHYDHRQGEEVDLSFNRPRPVPGQAISDVYEYLKSKEGITVPPGPAILWHLFDDPGSGSTAHFHVYLLGQKPSRITQY
jgi:hypothetical protein